MGSKYFIKKYSIYNVWANQRIAMYVKKLPPSLIQKEISSSYSSVWKTIEHIYHAECFWMLLITQTYNFENPQQDVLLNPETCLIDFLSQTRLLNEYVQKLSQADLQKEILTPFSDKKFAVCDLLHHVFNHATQHRGQLITMFRQLGLTNLPSVDYNEYLTVQIKE